MYELFHKFYNIVVILFFTAAYSSKNCKIKKCIRFHLHNLI